jgi:hypothetical protein
MEGSESGAVQINYGYGWEAQKHGSYGSESANICTDLDPNPNPDPDLSINKLKILENLDFFRDFLVTCYL